MTAKCHPAETVLGEGHGGVPAMGVVRLLGKQQPDKQYRLAPITETAAQATEAKGQKGKIAKRIFFPAALNCDSVLLLLSPDIEGHDGVLLGTAIFFKIFTSCTPPNVEKMLTTKDFSHAKSRDLAVWPHELQPLVQL